MELNLLLLNAQIPNFSWLIKEMVIGDGTWKALNALQAEKQKRSMLGMRSFFSTATSYLQ